MIPPEQVNMFESTEDPLERVSGGLYVAVKIIIMHF